MVFNQSGFRIGCGRIALSHFFNPIPLSFRIPQLEYGRVKQVSVSERGGDYFLSIVREAQEKPCHDNVLLQVIDLGVTKAATAINMQGKFFEARTPRPDRHWNPIIDALQSRRDRCSKGSRRWLRLHLAMKKCQRKLSNQIRDFSKSSPGGWWTTRRLLMNGSFFLGMKIALHHYYAILKFDVKKPSSKLNKLKQNQ